MIKVLLAQVLFKPAIIERELDWLGEPGIYDYGLGKSFYSMIEAGIIEDTDLCFGFRENYIAYYKDRLVQIIKWAIEREADLLVFPEYSIPYQCLPIIYDMSRNSGLTIIAGSHTVIHACEAYYSLSGLSEVIINEHLGESIAPIFMSMVIHNFNVN